MEEEREKIEINAPVPIIKDEVSNKRIKKVVSKGKRFVFSRVFMTFLFVLIQILYLFFVYYKYFDGMVYVRSVVRAVSVFFALYLVVTEHELQEYKIGWILLVLIVPIFGVPLYYLFGDKKVGRRYIRNSARAKECFRSYISQNPEIQDKIEGLDARLAGTSRYLVNDAGFPVYEGTAVRYYDSGEALYNGMIEDIRNARHFIFMEYFTIEMADVWETILDILMDKAEEGVEIRILYDDMGCASFLPHNYYRQLEDLHENIKCSRFNPIRPIVSTLMNNRDHRKMTIIDGSIAFTGGINLSDRYVNIGCPYGRWKDAGIRMEGEAVRSMTLMFLTMWDALRRRDKKTYALEAESAPDPEMYMPHAYHDAPFAGEGFVQPYGDEPFDEIKLSENAYTELINQAERYLYIFTPYLVLSDSISEAICIAARRGVDVRIVTPGVPDKKIVYRLTRASYKRFCSAGVRIYEFTPGFIHSKCMVADDTKAIVGTVNCDYRSLYLHFEDAVLFSYCPAVMDVRDDALRTFKISHEVGPEDMKTGLAGRFIDAFLKVMAPLM